MSIKIKKLQFLIYIKSKYDMLINYKVLKIINIIIYFKFKLCVSQI